MTAGDARRLEDKVDALTADIQTISATLTEWRPYIKDWVRDHENRLRAVETQGNASETLGADLDSRLTTLEDRVEAVEAKMGRWGGYVLGAAATGSFLSGLIIKLFL